MGSLDRVDHGRATWRHHELWSVKSMSRTGRLEGMLRHAAFFLEKFLLDAVQLFEEPLLPTKGDAKPDNVGVSSWQPMAAHSAGRWLKVPLLPIP